MKLNTYILSVVSLASGVFAAPASTVQARQPGLFGGNNANSGINHGDNLVSNIFDGAACIVSSVIGGGNPKCQGKGTATGKSPDGSQSRHYTYTYNTNQDGSLKVTITFDEGRNCVYNLQADGRKVQDVISQVAERCGNKK